MIIGLLVYDNYSKNLYSKLYKAEGIYTVGEIKEIKSYGRGTGYNFVYEFSINHNEYEARTNIEKLSINEAQTYKNKTFLVIYLKNNIHINRIYVSIPVSKSMTEIQLKQLIESNIEFKNKIDQVPSSSWFWENYL
ncbi:hypothetical protein [Chryseobacterium sp. MMS23-Vi53]|uniref:hypothetical protein n=1 Tax=Chryseobacterium sp. MMS23-Vi53 TaxID=3386644 RepID=UPI0039E990E1